MSGFFNVHRKIEESGFLTDGPLLQVFMKAMVEATYKGRSRMVCGEQVTLEPGEFIFGRKAWASDLCLSEKVVRNRIGTLQKRATIRAIKRASKFTVFKFVNWTSYQQQDEVQGPAEGPASGPTKGQQRASKGPHDNKGIKKEYIYTGNSDEPPEQTSADADGRPTKCDPTQWEKYLAYSEHFMTERHAELGKLAVPTRAKIKAGAIALDNLIRVKGFDRHVVSDTIAWAVRDDFWSTQLRSLGSLTNKSKSNGETKFENILAARFKESRDAA